VSRRPIIQRGLYWPTPIEDIRRERARPAGLLNEYAHDNEKPVPTETSGDAEHTEER
jgi:hypothetical protein